MTKRKPNGNIHPTRIFKTPEDLAKAWAKYKESLKEQAKQWEKIQYVGKEGKKKIDHPKLPLTLDGFQVWARKDYGIIGQYFDNTGKYYDDFIGICAHIRQEIRADQITGGLLGFYNPSITQRLNSLTEKTETTVKEQPLLDDI